MQSVFFCVIKNKVKKTHRLWSSHFIFITLIGLAGCKNTVEFDEEVLLNNGDRIVVHRLVRLERRGEFGSGATNVETFSQVTLPLSPKNLKWESTLLPVLIGKNSSSNFPVVVAVPLTCDDFNKFNRPNPSYIEFRYLNERWTPYPVSSELIGQKTNLFLIDIEVAAAKKYVSNDAKERQFSSGRLVPQYLQKIDKAHRSMCGK